MCRFPLTVLPSHFASFTCHTNLIPQLINLFLLLSTPSATLALSIPTGISHVVALGPRVNVFFSRASLTGANAVATKARVEGSRHIPVPTYERPILHSTARLLGNLDPSQHCLGLSRQVWSHRRQNRPFQIDPLSHHLQRTQAAAITRQLQRPRLHPASTPAFHLLLVI